LNSISRNLLDSDETLYFIRRVDNGKYKCLDKFGNKKNAIYYYKETIWDELIRLRNRDIPVTFEIAMTKEEIEKLRKNIIAIQKAISNQYKIVNGVGRLETSI